MAITSTTKAWGKRLFRSIRSIIRPSSKAAGSSEMEEEMRSHIEMLTRENMEAGMEPAEARYAAMKRFGWKESIKEVCREQRGIAWLENAVMDARFGFRQLRRNLGFTAACLIMLALGIGATTAMFGIVDVLLLRAPVHVRDAEELVRVYPKGWWRSENRSFPDYADLRDRTTSFSAVAGYQPDVTLSHGQGLESQPIAATRVTAGFFNLLGVRPVVGRFFNDAEAGEPDAENVVVVSHEIWRTRFGGAPDLEGRRFQLGKQSYHVIGVAPEGFTGAELKKSDVWLPLGTISSEDGWRTWPKERGSPWLKVLARLKPGVGRQAADQEANAANQRGWIESGQKSDGELMRLGSLLRARESQSSKEVRVTLWLACVAVAVCLIACANVAGLLLVRGEQRGRETAVRQALGAGKGRIVRQVMVECLLLGVLGGVSALAVAHVVTVIVRSYILPEGLEVSPLDFRVLMFAAAAAAASGLVSGLIPSLKAGSRDLVSALKSRGGQVARGGSATRSALLVGQVALTVALLIGAGLFVRSLRKAASVDAGIETERLVTLTAPWDGDDRKNDDLFRAMRERVQAVPGVESVSLSVASPFRSGWLQRMIPKGHEGVAEPQFAKDFFNEQFNAVTPDYFGTTGIRILKGRPFSKDDRAGAPAVIIVNESMARMIAPGGEALGMQFHLQTDQAELATIIGIATDSKTAEIHGAFTPQSYVPFDQPLVRGKAQMRALLIRTKIPPMAMTETIRRELTAAFPGLPRLDIRAMSAELEPQLLPWRLGATIFSLFGLLALSIAAVGIYGVVNHSVTQRTKEIGIRNALGADEGEVLMVVLRPGMVQVLFGIALGLCGGLALSYGVNSLLFGLKAVDPVTFIFAPLLLLGVGAIAGWAPARRAVRLNPVEALKCD